MKIRLTISFFLFTFALKAQVNLKQKISIQAEAVSLDSVFKILQTRHNIHLAYGIDNIPSNSLITIHANNQTLREIIQDICHQTGMTFTLIGNSVVLRYSKPPQTPQQLITSPPLSPEQHLPDSQTTRDTLHASPFSQPDSIQTSSPDTVKQQTLPAHDILDSLDAKQDALAVISETTFTTVTTKKSKHNFKPRLTASGISVSYALDYHQFHFQDRDISFQKFTPEKNSSIAIGAYTVFNKKLYISLGLGYATRDFVLSYNYQVLDPQDPMPIPDQTKVKLAYVEIPLTVGYHLYSKKRLSLWMSTGFYQSYLKDKKETTTYLNKGNPDTEYFLNTNQSSLSSLTLGFITHYYVFNRWGIFVEAGYLYCLDKVNTDVMESNTTTYRIKSGIHFSIHSKTKTPRI